MTKNYLEDKAIKKKSATKALWILLVFSVLAISVVVKITLTGSLKPDFFKGMPDSDDAYSIAKEFIRPTLKSSSADFSDTKYQFAKTSDSVYVIKSSVISKNESGDKVNTDFKITLKYNGGEISRQKNWTVVDLSEN
jgi:hypothetical protein